MVRFNLYDRNMEQIQADSKLFNLKTANKVWVFGLKAENPTVVLRHAPGKSADVIRAVARMLESNGIQAVCEEKTQGKADYSIGLRRDIRDHTSLCSAIVQTVVYALEERVGSFEGFRIPNAPSLPRFGAALNRSPANGQPNFTPEGRFDGFLWQEDTESPIWQWAGGRWNPYIPNSSPTPQSAAPVEPEFA